MEIQVRVSQSPGFDPIRVDIHLTDVDIKSLPSLTGDEIREMVRPIYENQLSLEYGDADRKEARRLSYLAVYGKERCRESFPALFDTEKGEEQPCSSCQ